MSEYPWNKNNNTFTWLSSLYNPFKGLAKEKNPLRTAIYTVHQFSVRFIRWNIIGMTRNTLELCYKISRLKLAPSLKKNSGTGTVLGITHLVRTQNFSKN